MSLPSRLPNTKPICAPMDTANKVENAGGFPRASCASRIAQYALWVALLALMPLSCTSVRPVVKLGLLAPFEGLYRRTGYLALDAMRLALTEASPGAVDFMPLALDSGSDVARSAQKLLADPSVGALIGPFTPVAVGQSQAVITERAMPWLIPFGLDAATQEPHQAMEQWLAALLRSALTLAQTQGATRLVVVGLPPAWAGLARLPVSSPGMLPVLYQPAGQDDLSPIRPTDAILHLGEPAVVAAYLRRLRADHADIPLLVGVQGDDPVFGEQSETIHAVYWAAWVDDGYDAWAATQARASPLAYQVYVATQMAIAALANQPPPAVTPWAIRWHISEQSQHPYSVVP